MSEVFPYGGTMGTLAVEMTDGQKLTENRSIQQRGGGRFSPPPLA